MTWRGVRGFAAAIGVCATTFRAAHAQTTVNVEPGQGVTVASEDGNTKINVGFYGQFRFQDAYRDVWRRSDLNQTFPPFTVENVGETDPTFRVYRLRLYAEGSVWKVWMRYKLELDLAGNDEGIRSIFIPPVFTSGGSSDFPGVNVTQGVQDQDGRTVKVLDWYIDLSPKPAARVRIGQFKVPYGRQELVPDNKLQMTSKSVASDFFVPGRDRGVVFYGGTDTQRVQYKVGVFNGNGLTRATNIDKTLAYGARLTATSSGPFLDVEDVIDQPPSLGTRVQAGVAWFQTTDTPVRLNPQVPVSDIQNSRLEGDVGIFFRQRWNLFLDYYQRKYEVEQGFDLPVSCYGAFIQGRLSCDQTGYSVQGGVRLGRTDHHELSARYSWIDNDRDLNDDEISEATLKYAYYFFKHTMQVSVSASYVTFGLNAAGSSGFLVKAANTTADFFDPAAFPGMTGDNGYVGIIQFQWTF
jgi:hypothetical protein